MKKNHAYRAFSGVLKQILHNPSLKQQISSHSNLIDPPAIALAVDLSVNSHHAYHRNRHKFILKSIRT